MSITCSVCEKEAKCICKNYRDLPVQSTQADLRAKIFCFKPLPNDKFLALTKFKAFAVDKSNVIKQ